MPCIHGAHSAALAAFDAKTAGFAWPEEWAERRDSVLQRYLKAANRDIEAAAQMVSSTIKWREELGVSRALTLNLPDDVLLQLTRHDRCFLAGWTTHGLPVFLESLDVAQCADLLASGTVTAKDVLWATIQSMEWTSRILMPLAARRTGKPCDKFVQVIDCARVSVSGLTAPVLDVFKQWAAVSRAHYPELVSKIYLINSPATIRVILSLLAPVIPEATRAKIVILGSGLHAFQVLKDALGPDSHIPVGVFTGRTAASPLVGAPHVASVLQTVVEYIADQQSTTVATPALRRTHTIMAPLPQSPEGEGNAAAAGNGLPRRTTFIRVPADAAPPACSRARRTLSAFSSGTAYHECDDDAEFSDVELEDERELWYACRALEWSEQVAELEQRSAAATSRTSCLALRWACFGRSAGQRVDEQ